MPYPAFDVARYAVLAAKIRKESDVVAQPAADKQNAIETGGDTNFEPAQIPNFDLSVLGSEDDQLAALNAVEDILSLSQNLNDSLHRTLDTYM
jgi:hypothetical protein